MRVRCQKTPEAIQACRRAKNVLYSLSLREAACLPSPTAATSELGMRYSAQRPVYLRYTRLSLARSVVFFAYDHFARY